MNVIGEAYVTITALADKFTSEVKSSTDPAFSGLKDTAGAGGLAAGEELGAGVEKGVKPLEDDLEQTGARGGSKLTSGLSSGLSKLGNIVETASGGLIPMSKATDKVAGSLEGADKQGGGFSSTMGKLGGGVMLGAAAGFVAVGVEAVNLDEKFQSTTASIAAGGDISTAAAQKIGNAFLDTAGKSTFSGQAIASAFSGVAGQVKLINGGVLDAAASMRVMDAATTLAEASGTSLDDSTKAVTNTLQSFGLGVKDSPLVANVLFNAARQTGQSVDAMGSTIDKARAKMGAAAPTIQDMGGLLVDLTAHGETGRAAMTVLGSAFTGIVNPTSKVIDAQKALGVSFLDANGKMLPMGDIIGQLGPKLAGMSQSQQIATLTSLGFGASSEKLLGTILAGPAAFDKSTASVSAAGSAHEAAEKQAATLHGQMETLKASVQDAATKWGAVLIPVLEKVGKVLVEVGNFIINHKAILITLGIVAGAVLLTMIGFWIGNTIAAMSFWVAATGGIIILVAALAVGIAWIVSHWSELWKMMKRVIEPVWHFIYGVFSDVKSWVMDAVNFITSHWQLLLAILLGPFALAALFIKDHFDEIKEWASEAVDAVLGFFERIPSEVSGFFSGIWDKIWSAFKTVGVWLVTNVEVPVINWFKSLPSKVAALFQGWWDKAWAEWKTVATWILNNVEIPVLDWFKGLPAKVASAIVGWWDKAWAELKTVLAWINTNVEQPVINYFRGLPGRVASTIGQFWDTAFAVLTTVLTWINTNVDQPVEGFFRGLPGKVASVIGDFYKTAFAGMVNIASWLETNVWQPMYAFFSGLADRVASAVGNLLGKITGSVGGAVGSVLGAVGIHLAEGGYFNKATPAVIGEAGPEVVLPLSNPRRMAEILGSIPGGGAGSSLGAMAGNASTGGGVTIQTDIVFAPQGVDVQDMSKLQAMFEETLDRHTDDVISALGARTGG